MAYYNPYITGYSSIIPHIQLITRVLVTAHLGLRLAIQNANLGGQTDCMIRGNKPVCPKIW